ncbi:MAG: antibiotic biosynthesis monooxygenase [Peptococcaceae bacterium]|nr:MAG: antibiotic biosynthesis monooxygenase [Peptococcaceae bacterium]
MVTLIARLKAKPGKETILIGECVDIAREVREKEKGCLMYVPHVSIENPGEIVFIEKYESREAFDAHLQTAYFKALAEKLEDLLDGPPVLQFLKELT